MPRHHHQKNFPASGWNIYCFQFSDGDNWGEDNKSCIELLAQDILPYSNLFCYGQVESPYGSGGALSARLRHVQDSCDNLTLSEIDSKRDMPSTIRSKCFWGRESDEVRSSEFGIRNGQRRFAAPRFRVPHSAFRTQHSALLPVFRLRIPVRIHNVAIIRTPILSTQRPLPAEIAAAQDEMERAYCRLRARFSDDFRGNYRLRPSIWSRRTADFIRYPHWRFGAQYEELTKSYAYGLSKIYEMVINTDPCYAYLLACNPMLDQKLVIAHVYGHCDFFKNNAWFAHTNRRMLDEMANHASRISRYIDRFGYEAVEQFIDACLSLEDLIDIYSPHIRRKGPVQHPVASALASDSQRDAERDDDQHATGTRFSSKGYMEAYINPPLSSRPGGSPRRGYRQEKNGHSPTSHSATCCCFCSITPHKGGRSAVLSIIRDQAYYFALPQGQTKIADEGWASFWHSKIMTRHGLTDAELIDYADHHSGTMATSRNRLNPYKLGIELLRRRRA